jgi:hypothetical protein
MIPLFGHLTGMNQSVDENTSPESTLGGSFKFLLAIGLGRWLLSSAVELKVALSSNGTSGART